MAKPIFIPLGKTRFLHPHLGRVSFMETETTPVLVPVLWCESLRPFLDPSIRPLLLKQGYVRDFTPCGQEIHWRLK